MDWTEVAPMTAERFLRSACTRFSVFSSKQREAFQRQYPLGIDQASLSAEAREIVACGYRALYAFNQACQAAYDPRELSFETAMRISLHAGDRWGPLEGEIKFNRPECSAAIALFAQYV